MLCLLARQPINQIMFGSQHWLTPSSWLFTLSVHFPYFSSKMYKYPCQLKRHTSKIITYFEKFSHNFNIMFTVICAAGECNLIRVVHACIGTVCKVKSFFYVIFLFLHNCWIKNSWNVQVFLSSSSKSLEIQNNFKFKLIVIWSYKYIKYTHI